jgi:hypothetical protein
VFDLLGVCVFCNRYCSGTCLRPALQANLCSGSRFVYRPNRRHCDIKVQSMSSSLEKLAEVSPGTNKYTYSYGEIFNYPRRKCTGGAPQTAAMALRSPIDVWHVYK